MRTARTLFALAAVVLTSPALAADVSYRDVAKESATSPEATKVAASPRQDGAKTEPDCRCHCAATKDARARADKAG